MKFRRSRYWLLFTTFCLMATASVVGQPRVRVAQQESAGAAAIPDAPSAQIGLPKGSDPYVQTAPTSNNPPSLLDSTMPAISGAPQAPNFAAPGNPSGLAPPASDPWQGQPYNGAAGEGAAPGLELIPRNADGDLFWGEKIRFLQGRESVTLGSAAVVRVHRLGLMILTPPSFLRSPTF